MQFIRIHENHFEQLKALHAAYKEEIGEEPPSEEDFSRLLEAIRSERILFFGTLDEQSRLAACCSVSLTFSTFNYRTSGVFEDFYIVPAGRHQGLARALVAFAVKESGVQSLTVGCADCDAAMYGALGFSIPLGRLLAMDL